MSQTQGVGKQYVWGFDLIRCLAMALVTSRHLLSIHDYDNSVIPDSWGLGIFSVLSGYLAFQPSSRAKRESWFLARIARIYPPYFIALTMIFVLNFYFRYKPMSWDLVAAQYLAVAPLTHPGQLVGVHTWFITMVLICYVIAAVTRRDTRLLPAAVVMVTTLAAVGIFPPIDSKLTACILAFLAGGVIAVGKSRPIVVIGVVLAGVLGRVMGHPGFSFPLFGTLGLLAAMCLVGQTNPWLLSTREIIYEYYLMHGLVYLALAEKLNFSLVANLVVGGPLAILAAWSLSAVNRRGMRALWEKVNATRRVRSRVSMRPESRLGLDRPLP